MPNRRSVKAFNLSGEAGPALGGAQLRGRSAEQPLCTCGEIGPENIKVKCSAQAGRGGTQPQVCPTAAG